MALKYKLRKRRNIPGEFFVDERWVISAKVIHDHLTTDIRT